MAIYLKERPSAMPAVCMSLLVAEAALAPVAPVAQVHQVQAQAELILAPVPGGAERTSGSAGVNGTNGFMGEGIQTSKRRLDVRGVPPRGRPV